LLLLDERRGRAVAGRFGLRVVGLLGVLLDAKQRGLILEVKPLLEALRHAGFHISQELFDRVVQAAGE
jgi:predicted nucleic acid-binding protein